MSQGEIVEPVVTMFTQEEAPNGLWAVSEEFTRLERFFDYCENDDFSVVLNEASEYSGIPRVRRELRLDPERAANLWRYYTELALDDPIPEVFANGAYVHVSSSTDAHDHFLGFGGVDDDGNRINVFELHSQDITSAEVHEYPREGIELPEDLLQFATDLVAFVRSPVSQMETAERYKDAADYRNLQKLLRKIAEPHFYVDPESDTEIAFEKNGFSIRSPRKRDADASWAIISDTEIPATLQRGFNIEVDFTLGHRGGEIRLSSKNSYKSELRANANLTLDGQVYDEKLDTVLAHELAARGISLGDLLKSTSKNIKALLPHSKTQAEIDDSFEASVRDFTRYILSAGTESRTDLVEVYEPHKREAMSFAEAEYSRSTRTPGRLPLFAVARLSALGEISEAFLAVPGPVSKGWPRIGLCRINDDETYDKYQGGWPFGKAYDRGNLVTVRIGEYDPEPSAEELA